MYKINILNKQGFLTNEDRKESLEHGCENFTFKTCLDLTEPILVTPYGSSKTYNYERYSRDVAAFFVFWTTFVLKDLNGFSGLHNVEFKLNGFTLV